MFEQQASSVNENEFLDSWYKSARERWFTHPCVHYSKCRTNLLPHCWLEAQGRLFR